MSNALSFDERRTEVPGAPTSVTCYVRDCGQAATHNHHITYNGRVVGNWGVVPLCPGCHKKLHALHEPVRDQIPLELFSLRFIMSPGPVERRILKKIEFLRAAPPNVDPRQLSFEDMHGKDGEYWRRLWLDEVKDPEAPRHRDRQRWRREAA